MTYEERKALAISYLGKNVNIEIDRPIGFIHKKDNYSLTYPINYGYIPGVIGGDGEELDVYLLGVSEPVKKYSAKIIGIVHRHNDTEDKLIAAPDGTSFTAEQIAEQIRFQEQYYEIHIETINYIAEHYDTLIDQNNDPVHDPEPLKAYMDKWDGDSFIEKLYLKKNKKVLEIGVGTGRLAVKTAPFCKEFYGIDISPKTTQRAKENLVAYKNVNLICGDFLEYNFKDTFDTVYSSLTFMHIEDKLKAVCKIFDMLSDGGIFVLSIDKNQDEFIDIGTSKIKIFPDTPENIVCCLNCAGFHLSEQFETEFAHIFVAKKYCKCYCGHDCSKCVTYIATKTNDNILRGQAKSFYKSEFSQDISLESFNCFGGRTENPFILCNTCPFKKCCKEKNIVACDQCSNYPCNMLEEYQKKYVNKCNQIKEDK